MNFHIGKSGKRLAALVITLVMAIGLLAGAGMATRASADWYEDLTGANGRFYADYDTYAEEQEAAREHNVALSKEGMVLLKNKDNVLPLDKSANKITLLGSNSYPSPSPVTRLGTTGTANIQHGFIFGGTGSGQGTGTLITLPAAFKSGGYNLNPRPFKVYERVQQVERISRKIGGLQDSRVEIPVDYISEIYDLQGVYTDALITTVSRIAGEGGNLWQGGQKNADKGDVLVTHADVNDHYLQLDDNENDLIDYMKDLKAANKEKGIDTPIIILLNAANPMELGALEDDPDIDAILWVGYTGVNGTLAIPDILNGTVNPSGRLVDTYAADFFADPVSVSFWEDKLATSPDANRKNKFANHMHEDDIYFGYKWYETAYAEGILDQTPFYDAAKATVPADKAGLADEVYYNRSTGVVYPFGYGLSYTEFEQELITGAAELQAAIDAARGLDTMVDVKVKVKNVGGVAGKDVVQLYASAPYTAGGIEKAEVQLVAFGKSRKLNPGAETIVNLKVRLGDIASFDYNDANANGWTGWEIEPGAYDFRLQNNSHDVIDEITCTLAEHKTDLDNDSDATNNTPLSRVRKNSSDPINDWDNIADKWDSSKYSTHLGGMELMSRADMVGTYPGVADTASEKGRSQDPFYTDEYKDFVDDTKNADKEKINRPYTEFDDKPTDLWYKTVADIPADWTQRETAYGLRMAPAQMSDMAGLDYDDSSYTLEYGKTTNVEMFDGKTPAQAWDLFMNQLTLVEMQNLVSNVGFSTPAVDSIGKIRTVENDGPAQLNYNAMRFTYTKDTTSNIAIWSGGGLAGTFWCSEVNIASTWNVDLARKQGVFIGNEGLFGNVTGWYGPGVQLHRSPFIGRNFEYYSQDGLHGGMIAAAIIGGAQSKGLNCYAKHFGFLSHGGPGSEVATEQSLRETHLKPYELAVKFGQCTGMMACANFGTWSGTSHYALNQQVAYQEWGFKGVMITDWYGTYAGWANYMQRTGTTWPLNGNGGFYSPNINKMGGTWDAAKRDGKGMVVETEKYDPTLNDGEGGLATVTAIDAPNHWYYTREAARNALWMSANTAANYNGLNKTKLYNTVTGNAEAEKVIEIKRGMTYAAGSAPTTATTNQYVSAGVTAEMAAEFGSLNNYYELASGTLPAGLSLDYKTGSIVGSTTAAAGNTNVTVRILGDGWFRVNYTVTIKVTDLLTPSVALNATAGTEFSTKFTQSAFTVGGTYNGYPITAVGNYSLRTSVPGLTMAEDGTLSGTPTAPGTYDITVRVPVTYTTPTSRTSNIDTVYTLVVKDKAQVEFRVEAGALQYRIGETGTWANISTGGGTGYDDTAVLAAIAAIETDISALKSGKAAQADLTALMARVVVLEGMIGDDGVDLTALYAYLDAQIEEIALTPGPAGKSAYDIAKDNGYTGTVTEWLASLKGEAGAPGEAGGGCNAVIAGSGIALGALLLTGTAFILIARKKKEQE